MNLIPFALVATSIVIVFIVLVWDYLEDPPKRSDDDNSDDKNIPIFPPF